MPQSPPGHVSKHGPVHTRLHRCLAVALAAAIAGVALGGCEPDGAGSREPAKEPAASPTGDPNEGAEHDRVDGGVPAAAMLRPADLGDGYRAHPDDGAHWWLEMLLSGCADQPPSGGGGQGSRIRLLDTANHEPINGVYQGVYREGGDSAADYVESLRQAVAGCEGEGRLTLVDEDFVGDQSFLVSDEYDGRVSYYAVVRRGDVHTQLLLAGDDASENRVRTLARTASKRLCQATGTC